MRFSNSDKFNLTVILMVVIWLMGCGPDKAGDRFSAGKKSTSSKKVGAVAAKTAGSSEPVTTINPVQEVATAQHKTPFPFSGESYTVRNRKYYVLASAAGYVEEGEASWYGRKFHGRKTACGERYDMHALTAAHKILPFGTQVKVTNLVNDLEAVVRINDRGPFYPEDRIIDLSFAAAQRLKMVSLGHVPVRIEVRRSQGINQSAGLALSGKEGFNSGAIKMKLRYQQIKMRYKQALAREVHDKKEKP